MGCFSLLRISWERDGSVLTMSGLLLELPKEPDVVGIEEANVVDSVLEHGYALGPEAEGEAGVDAGVVADPLEHLG